MVEFTHVLAPVDFSGSSARALAHAAAVARWYGARLTVLHVAPTFDPMPVSGELGAPVRVVAPLSEEEVRGEIGRLLDATGVSADAIPVARAGDPPTTILDEAVKGEADLIVMGTQGRRGFKRLLLGSVAETVLREAPCAVLTVPPQVPAATAEPVLFKRILCPVDFSSSSLHALGFALDLARQSDGRVTLVHVIEWLPEEAPRAIGRYNVPEFRQQMQADAEGQLDALVAGESRTWLDIEKRVLFGRAYRRLLQAAEERHNDLIVMGAQGRGGVELALFGSTTQEVVRGASCPVLTVRGTPGA